jgi:hypothetical protein
LETAQSLRFWYRQKYRLPETDPRILDLTDIDLAEEYWAYRFWDVMQKERRIPAVEEFDHDWLDSEVARWAVEDEGELALYEQTKNSSDWEEVTVG